MSKLFLTCACRDYDRVRPIMDGVVQPEGIDLNFINMHVPEIFWRSLRHAEFDICEISLSGYLITLERQPQPYTAIPVFPSRSFRHNSIFVNTNAGIFRPQDLVGKKVGVREYSMTAAVWVRGVLQHEYGVLPDAIRWLRGGQTKPSAEEERVELHLPADFHLENIPSGRWLDEMLESGDLDALISPQTPVGLRTQAPKVARLFPNYRTVEMEYYKRTHVFPIMHTVAIKRDIYERHPWVAQSLYKAFRQAKDICTALLDEGTLRYTLPWWLAELEAELDFFDGDLWPYGVHANLNTLESLCQYSFEQGLTRRKMKVDELFAPETVYPFQG